MLEYRAYVGLDVHKETIATAVAWPGREEPEYRGILPNHRKSLNRLINTLQGTLGEALSFVYEAGPCGYGVYREITGTGHDCQVVAPTLIPRKSGDRVKTDRRDAVTLARLHRAGELTPVWVPGPDQEAVRDLTRAREDMKAAQTRARQRLGGLPASPWPGLFGEGPLDTGAFPLAGGAEVRASAPAAGLPGVRGCGGRGGEADRRPRDSDARDAHDLVAAPHGRGSDESAGHLDDHGDDGCWPSSAISRASIRLASWWASSVWPPASTRPALADVRERSPGRAMATSVGSWSSRRGRIASRRGRRRICARKAARASDRVQAIAWAAQKRLCGRYAKLYLRGKAKNKVVTAVARELVGFIWAIACEVGGKPHGTRAVA